VSTATRCDCGFTFATQTGICRHCGVSAPTKYVEFRRNIGMLVVRRSESIKGTLCKRCINQFFWSYTAVTLIAGWWGVVSFFVTPVFIVLNIVTVLGTIRLPPPSRPAPPGPERGLRQRSTKSPAVDEPPRAGR
jgi:hypothetical protein